MGYGLDTRYLRFVFDATLTQDLSELVVTLTGNPSSNKADASTTIQLDPALRDCSTIFACVPIGTHLHNSTRLFSWWYPIDAEHLLENDAGRAENINHWLSGLNLKWPEPVVRMISSNRISQWV